MSHSKTEFYNIGMDVCKKTLDVFILGLNKSRHVDNNAQGLTLLREQLPDNVPRVVMESTGGLEQNALNYLSTKGFNVRVVNPRNVRRFAQGLGILAKTDPLDAKVLARYGEVAKPIVTQAKSKDEQQLSDYLSRRRQVTQMLANDKAIDHSP